MTTSVQAQSSQSAGLLAQAGSALSGAVDNVKGAGSTVGSATVSTVSYVASVAGSAISAAGAAVPKGLVVLDKVLDFIPFGSTANNLVDLGVKHLVVKDMDPNSSVFKEYIEHVQNKESKACLVFGIPFVGNVAKIGSVVYSYVSGGEGEEKKIGDEPFNLPPALGEAGDGSTLAARLLENEHGTLVYRDPLETSGTLGGYHVNSATLAAEVQRL